MNYMGQTNPLQDQDTAPGPFLQGTRPNGIGEEQGSASAEQLPEILWRTLLQPSELANPSLQGTLKANLAEAILEGRIPEGTR